MKGLDYIANGNISCHSFILQSIYFAHVFSKSFWTRYPWWTNSYAIARCFNLFSVLLLGHLASVSFCDHGTKNLSLNVKRSDAGGVFYVVLYRLDCFVGTMTLEAMYGLVCGGINLYVQGKPNGMTSRMLRSLEFVVISLCSALFVPVKQTASFHIDPVVPALRLGPLFRPVWPSKEHQERQ